jgi:hypothetical protein
MIKKSYRRGFECVECGRVDGRLGQFCERCWFCVGYVATVGHDPECDRLEVDDGDGRVFWVGL